MPVDSVRARTDGHHRLASWRPVVRGRRHVVVAGHYLAAQTGFKILEAGGNAVDAGVAAGLTLGIVQSEFVNFAGEADIDGGTGDALADLGYDIEWWPKRTWRAGGACVAVLDRQTGAFAAGADPRRPSYAVGCCGSRIMNG